MIRLMGGKMRALPPAEPRACVIYLLPTDGRQIGSQLESVQAACRSSCCKFSQLSVKHVAGGGTDGDYLIYPISQSHIKGGKASEWTVIVGIGASGIFNDRSPAIRQIRIASGSNLEGGEVIILLDPATENVEEEFIS